MKVVTSLEDFFPKNGITRDIDTKDGIIFYEGFYQMLENFEEKYAYEQMLKMEKAYAGAKLQFSDAINATEDEKEKLSQKIESIMDKQGEENAQRISGEI